MDEIQTDWLLIEDQKTFALYVKFSFERGTFGDDDDSWNSFDLGDPMGALFECTIFGPCGRGDITREEYIPYRLLNPEMVSMMERVKAEDIDWDSYVDEIAAVHEDRE